MRATGLLSVTFRKLSAEQIIKLTAQAGLDGIEWGGDVHVIPGNLKRAEEIKNATVDAGLVNFAYGSYWRANCEPEMIAETAEALGVQWIRIWAGVMPSSKCTVEMRKQTVEYLQKLCSEVPFGMQVVAEWHCNSLTDNAESAVKLIEEVNADNFFCYFQRENRSNPHVDNLNDLLSLPKEKIRAIHVHYCKEQERLPLSDGFNEWQELFKHIPEKIPALLEFVRNDSVEQFFEDAEFLKKLIKI